MISSIHNHAKMKPRKAEEIRLRKIAVTTAAAVETWRLEQEDRMDEDEDDASNSSMDE
jgi:hypothetical protein